MIPFDDPSRCPTCRGIHPGICPRLIVRTEITEERDQANRLFLERRIKHPDRIMKPSKTSYRAPAPQTPTNSSECQKGFAQPMIRYTPRCNTCEGKREIVALRGGMRPCPRCSEE